MSTHCTNNSQLVQQGVCGVAGFFLWLRDPDFRVVWGYLPAIFLVHFSPDLNESNGKWTSVPVVILLYDHLLLWVVIYSLSDELHFSCCSSRVVS